MLGGGGIYGWKLEEPLGGGGDIDMLGVSPCITKLVSTITSDFLHRFTHNLTQ